MDVQETDAAVRVINRQNQYSESLCQQLQDARAEIERLNFVIERGGETLERLEAENARLREALEAIKGLLGPDGEYAICKADGTKLWLGDDMIVGGVFEKADAALTYHAD